MGWILAWIWRGESQAINERAIELLELRSDSRLLEIGFGPGETLRRILARVDDLEAVGIDASPQMLKLASRRNKAAIADGRLVLRLGVPGAIPESLGVFTHILVVHCIYFLDDLDRALALLAGALEPGGVMVVAAVVNDGGLPKRFQTPAYKFQSTDEIGSALESSGLGVEVHRSNDGYQQALRWFRATKP